MLPNNHPTVLPPKVGVLVVNLGTPDATDYFSMRRYLSEFLSDRRVIELNPLLWQPILQGIILTFRPKKSGHAYEQIWNTDKNESPLLTFTRDQRDALRDHAAEHWPNVEVEMGMRYGNPSMASGLDALKEKGCQRIVLAPLYPQYSAATTATVNDKAFDWFKSQRWQPALRTMPQYHDRPEYIDAIARTVKSSLAELDFEPELLISSFHGVPKEYLEKGDPYHCFCAKSGRLMKEALGMNDENYIQTFQSRFGPKEWLKPYTDETVEAAAKRGVKKLAIFAPGFASDCVETLEEISIGLRETFIENGGEQFAYLPCLNATEAGNQLIAQLVETELQGWV